MSVPVHVSLYIQTSTFPYSLTGPTKAYLCKVLGNLPSSFQHIGACLTFTRAPTLSNSRLQHLWPLNSLSVSPSTCQCQSATDWQHIQIPAAGTPVSTRACIVSENALLHSLVLLFSTKVIFSDVLGDVTVHTGLHLKQTYLMLVIQNIFQLPALFALTRHNSDLIKAKKCESGRRFINTYLHCLG